jgi:hypothetical protein
MNDNDKIINDIDNNVDTGEVTYTDEQFIEEIKKGYEIKTYVWNMNEHMRNHASDDRIDVISQFLTDNKQLDNNSDVIILPHWLDDIFSGI